jgi:hypothetical protein
VRCASRLRVRASGAGGRMLSRALSRLATKTFRRSASTSFGNGRAFPIGSLLALTSSVRSIRKPANLSSQNITSLTSMERAAMRFVSGRGSTPALRRNTNG